MTSAIFENYLLVPKMIAGVEPPQRLVAICTNASVQNVLQHAVQSDVWQVFDREHSKNQKKSIALSAAVALHPDKVLEDPIRAFFGPPSQDLHKKVWEFRASTEKSRTIEAIVDYVGQIASARAIKDNIRYIADELFTNAIFNAPFENEDLSLDRTSLVVLDPEMSAQLVIAHDNEELIIGCIDYFGNLKCGHLIEHLAKVSDQPHISVLNMGKGGAGIGLFQALQSSNGLIGICEEKKKTFIAATLRLGASARSVLQAPKKILFHSFETLLFDSIKIKIERRKKSTYVTYLGETFEPEAFKSIDFTGAETLYLHFSPDLIISKRTQIEFEKCVESLRTSHQVFVVSK